jgi:hypothetical protein
MAGVSRSITLVIAYIMQKSQIPYQLAYDYVKSKRSIVIYVLIFRFIPMIPSLSSSKTSKKSFNLVKNNLKNSKTPTQKVQV